MYLMYALCGYLSKSGRKLDQEKMAVIETAIKKTCSIRKECELFL